MNKISILKNAATAALLLATLAAFGAAGSGCAYGGVTSMSDGTVILTRNSLLGALRKVFVCKVVGNDLKCVESASAP